MKKIIVTALLTFSCLLWAKAQDSGSPRCEIPAPLSEIEKAQIIENIRQIVRDGNESVKKFKRFPLKDLWTSYFNCLNDSTMPDLSHAERLRISKENEERAFLATLSALGADGENAEAKIIAAQAAMFFDVKTRSVDLARKALALDAENHEAHFVLGLLNADPSSIEKTIALNPNFAPAHRQKILILFKQAAEQKEDERLKIYEAAGEAIKKMLTLSALPDADFWHIQLLALNEQIKFEKVQKLAEKNQNAAIIPLKIISCPHASYTDEARGAGVSGTVKLQVWLGSDGQVKSILALSFVPYGMTQQAINAARKITFEPEIRNNQPVSALRHVEYRFEIF